MLVAEHADRGGFEREQTPTAGSDGRLPAVDGQVLARDVAGAVARKENSECGLVGGVGQPAERDPESPFGRVTPDTDSTSPRACTSTSISVAVEPGEIVLTVIPCGASSSAMQRAAWTRAAFDAA